MTIFEYLAISPVALTISTGVFGLFIGSFLNVVIHRLPIMLDREWKKAAKEILADPEQSTETEEEQPEELPEEVKEEPYNLVVPRSACPHCGHQIKSYENIPVISWLFLRGKCSNCKTPISSRYPLIELLTGLLFAACAFTFGYSSLTLWTCLLMALLISLSMIDFDTKLLPDQLVYILLWSGLLANMFGAFTSLTSAVLGALIGYLVLWSFYWAFKLLTGKEGMGYGDFKLFAALGAWFGWQSLLVIILLSSIAGAIIGILLITLSSKDKNTTIPFGPYLAIAGVVYLFYGPLIIQSYMQYMGLA